MPADGSGRFFEKGGRAACDGSKGVDRAECSDIVLRCLAGNSDKNEGMRAAAECATQLRIGRALLAGRRMRRLFILLRLFGQNMAECVHSRALLRKQQGEGEQQREQETHGLHGGATLTKNEMCRKAGIGWLGELLALQLVCLREVPGARDAENVGVLADVLRERRERRGELHDALRGGIQYGLSG